MVRLGFRDCHPSCATSVCSQPESSGGAADPGADWRGWLVTDFYAAYNLIPGHHQRCRVHLLRDLHQLKQAQAANAEVLLWVTGVRQLYDAAHTWLVAPPSRRWWSGAHSMMTSSPKPVAWASSMP